MYKLTPENVAAIEKALMRGGRTEAVVKVENGKIAVLLVEKKKIG